MLLLITLYALSTFALTANIVHNLPPLLLLGTRMSVAGILLFIFLGLRKQIKLSAHHSSLYLQVIVCAVFIPYTLRYYGLLSASGPRALLLYNLGPCITYLFTHWYGIEKITFKRTCALFIAMLGFIISLNACLVSYCTPFGFGDIALLASAIFFSYGWICMRRLVVDLEYSPLAANSIAMTGGGFLALGLCSFQELPIIQYPWHTALALAGIILMSNLLAHNLYAYALRTYSLTCIQLGYLAIPALTALGHSLFIHGSLTTIPAHMLCAALLIGCGFWLMYKQEQSVATAQPLESLPGSFNHI